MTDSTTGSTTSETRDTKAPKTIRARIARDPARMATLVVLGVVWNTRRRSEEPLELVDSTGPAGEGGEDA